MGSAAAGTAQAAPGEPCPQCGGWSVLDPSSSNGTQVNDADIETGVAVPLNPGDRISLGAWTVLTLQT
jgi:predicted component of type VI protein secretion system